MMGCRVSDLHKVVEVFKNNIPSLNKLMAALHPEAKELNLIMHKACVSCQLAIFVRVITKHANDAADEDTQLTQEYFDTLLGMGDLLTVRADDLGYALNITNCKLLIRAIATQPTDISFDNAKVLADCRAVAKTQVEWVKTTNTWTSSLGFMHDSLTHLQNTMDTVFRKCASTLSAMKAPLAAILRGKAEKLPAYEVDEIEWNPETHGLKPPAVKALLKEPQQTLVQKHDELTPFLQIEEIATELGAKAEDIKIKIILNPTLRECAVFQDIVDQTLSGECSKSNLFATGKTTRSALSRLLQDDSFKAIAKNVPKVKLFIAQFRSFISDTFGDQLEDHLEQCTSNS